MKGTVAVFIPTMHRTGRHRYIQYLSDRLAQEGYRTFCFCSYSDLFWQDGLKEGEKKIYELYRLTDIKAAVIYTELIKDNALCEGLIAECSRLGIPAFTVERPIDGAYNIVYDHSASFERIVDHVIEKHGARNIFMLSGMRDNSFSEDRNNAYRRSLEKHGIGFDSSKVYYGDFWDLPARNAAEQMLAEHEQLPDAVVCANDVMAISVCLVLGEHGIKVPEDVIVTGFDGTERARAFFPTVSTSAPDYRSSSDYVCSLIERSERGALPAPETVSFGGSFTKGQSCGCELFDQRVSGAMFADQYERIGAQKLLRYENDGLMLKNIGSRSLVTVLREFENNLRIMQLKGIEIFLNTSYFGIPSDSGELVLAAGIDPRDQSFNMPFTSLSEGHICTDALTDTGKPIIFLPLFSIGKSYGYAAAPFDPADLEECEKMYDLIIHLNILLSSIETTVMLNDLYVHDQLTGLLNRYGFYQCMEDIITSAQNDGKDLLIISTDLNKLKYINDTFGHAEGDNAIASAAAALSEAVGEYGICARFGGDEYLALITADIDEKTAADRIAAALERINSSSGKPYSVSMSIGMERAAPESADDLHELIRAADGKMFIQKQQSGNERK